MASARWGWYAAADGNSVWIAVLMVAGVAAVISNQHVYELVTTHGEIGFTARRASPTVWATVSSVPLWARGGR